MPTGNPENTTGRGSLLTRRQAIRLILGGGASAATAFAAETPAGRALGLAANIVEARALQTETSFPIPEYELGSGTELATILNGMLTETDRTSASPIDVPLSINVAPQPDAEQPSFFGYDQNSQLGQRLGGILTNLHSLLNDGARGAIDFNARVKNGVITNVAPYIRLTADYQNQGGLQFLADSTLALDTEGGLHYQIPIPGIADQQRGRTSSIRPVRLDETTYQDYVTLMQQKHPEFIPQAKGTLLMAQVIQEPGARQGKIAVVIAQDHPVSFINGFSEFGRIRQEPTPTAAQLGTVSRASEPVTSPEDREAFRQLYGSNPNVNFDAPVVYAAQLEDGQSFTWYAMVDHSDPPVYGFTRSDVSPLNIDGPVTQNIAALRVAEYRAPSAAMAEYARRDQTLGGTETRVVNHSRYGSQELTSTLSNLPQLTRDQLNQIPRLHFTDGSQVPWSFRGFIGNNDATMIMKPGYVERVIHSDGRVFAIIGFPSESGVNYMVTSAMEASAGDSNNVSVISRLTASPDQIIQLAESTFGSAIYDRTLSTTGILTLVGRLTRPQRQELFETLGDSRQMSLFMLQVNIGGNYPTDRELVEILRDRVAESLLIDGSSGQTRILTGSESYIDLPRVVIPS